MKNVNALRHICINMLISSPVVRLSTSITTLTLLPKDASCVSLYYLYCEIACGRPVQTSKPMFEHRAASTTMTVRIRKLYVNTIIASTLVDSHFKAANIYFQNNSSIPLLQLLTTKPIT